MPERLSVGTQAPMIFPGQSPLTISWLERDGKTKRLSGRGEDKTMPRAYGNLVERGNLHGTNAAKGFPMKNCGIEKKRGSHVRGWDAWRGGARAKLGGYGLRPKKTSRRGTRFSPARPLRNNGAKSRIEKKDSKRDRALRPRAFALGRLQQRELPSSS